MNTQSVSFFNNEPSSPNIAGSQIILAAWQLKNPENIGNIIRLTHNLGAAGALFVGDKLKYKGSKIRKTAGMSYEQTDWRFIGEDHLLVLQNEGFDLVALETSKGSNNLYNISLPGKMILIGGNEIHGLPPAIIEKCNAAIHIPMPGGCKSMNISHAMAVASFEWYRQYSQ